MKTIEVCISEMQSLDLWMLIDASKEAGTFVRLASRDGREYLVLREEERS